MYLIGQVLEIMARYVTNGEGLEITASRFLVVLKHGCQPYDNTSRAMHDVKSAHIKGSNGSRSCAFFICFGDGTMFWGVVPEMER